jgi:hypothetical protein
VTRQRFRYSSATTVAAIIMAISGVSLGSYAPYLLPLLIIPLGAAVWTWRAGTDADTTAIIVRGGLRSRRLPWSTVTGLVADPRGRVSAQLDSGASVRLTAVTAADLPHLVAASGHELERQEALTQ